MKSIDNITHIFNKYAKLYHEKYRNVGLYQQALDLFYESIKTGHDKILDIGCGPGNITQYLLSKNPILDIMGIDLAENMIELAKTNNPQACFQVLDCRNINQINQTFDGVICSFCLPYLNLNETNRLIIETANLLNKGGILYLSCMEDKYENSGLQGPSSGDDDGIQTYYYQTQQLKEILIKHGFSVINSYQLNNPQQTSPSIKDLVIIARNSE